MRSRALTNHAFICSNCVPPPPPLSAQMAPSTAKRAKGADLEARVHRDADPPSETLPLDIRGVVKPAGA